MPSQHLSKKESQTLLKDTHDDSAEQRGDGDEDFPFRSILGPDGQQVASVFDSMTILCGYSGAAAARTEFKRMVQHGSEHRKKLTSLCSYVKFPGAGQRETPCMTMPGLLILAHCLGNKVLRAFRDESLTILQRYLNGDATLHAEIDENMSLGKRKSYENFAVKVAKRAQTYQDAQSYEMPPVSYVYATKSEAFPNLIKIGRSINVAARLSSINTSCAPSPHVIVAAAPTFNSTRDEALAHAHFSSSRKQGEFFNVPLDEVRSFFTDNITARYQLELTQHISRVQGQH
jgi:hypothetical protein